MIGVRYNLQVQDRVTSVTNYGKDCYWDGRLLKATCYRKPHKPDHRDVPEDGCYCGMYAYSKISYMDGIVDWLSSAAITVLVEAYGKIILHTKGFRSEYMRPMYVIWPLEITELRLDYEKTIKAGSVSSMAQWTRDRVFYPNVDLAIKASKILGVPVIPPEVAEEILK